MQSRWSDSEARRAIAHYGEQGLGEALALRVYTTRLLGGDPHLVLHGGGNTSVKTRMPDLLGAETDVLCVKGSGWDMAVIEPPGLPAVRLAPLLALRQRDTLSDEDMVRIQRASLLDPMAPNPSVETLLHAFLPHAFVDHTHATALLSLIDQPNGEDIAREVYGARVGIVPYVMPGFALAKKAAEVYDADPSVEGLVLDKHGLFTFGADARESYERTIALVTLAEERLACGRKTFATTAPSAPPPERGRSDREAIREGVNDDRPPLRPSPLQGEGAALADVAPIVRGACSLEDESNEGAWRRMVLDFRASERILAFVGGEEIERYANAGVVTPDHTIRTKNWPLILPPVTHGDLAEFRAGARAAATAFVAGYRAYFATHNARVGGTKRMLDPLPRVVLLPGLGLFGLGRSKKEAKIVADLAEVAAETILDAEAIGRFEAIGEADMFDMEYWSLEQAKLGSAAEKPLAGQVTVVTGAGGAIGAATAKAFAAAGAEVALLDRDIGAAQAAAKAIGGAALAVSCDVTDAASVREAFDTVVETFGGVDIAVSNAGAARQGRIGEVDEQVLRDSFELNFYGHQRVAQNAVRIMRAQGTGGCLLFNVSKQAVNPGPNFGPYGLPKAATLLLVRQYALEYGADGIRANAVNADRIRSGLLTEDFIAQRAKARGVSEAEYMRGNLLAREVTADDVAQAFLHQALQLKTTGDVTTVDGGNIAAALR
jgi:rhamnose utilization protein RhaD (predicted bifunctional aldolase and dehydrogenase)/NAD(P)-dependent dehydrogenase (short-subunit alcohol dehydrogenase family)